MSTPEKDKMSIDEFINSIKSEPEPDNFHMKTDLFMAGLKRIEKILVETENDHAKWRFFCEYNGIDGIVGVSDYDLQTKKSKFMSQFKSQFKIFPPAELMAKPKKGQVDPWMKFLIWIEQKCVEIAPEATEAFGAVNRILDVIASKKWYDEDNKVMWVHPTKGKQRLLRKAHDNIVYYLLKTGDISDIYTDLKITTPLNKIGGIMEKHKLKRPHNPSLWINKTRTEQSIWWITEDCLIEHGFEPEAQKQSDIDTVGGY